MCGPENPKRKERTRLSGLEVSILANTEPAVDDERELIDRIKRDRNVFREVFDRHYGRIAEYVFRRTGDIHGTEDIVSDVFLRAMQAIGRYRHNGTPLQAWLLRIATNEINRGQRRDGVRKRATLELAQRARASTPCTDSNLIDANLAGLLLRALPTKHQEVLSLHLGCGYSIDEIAMVLGCRPGTVKSRLFRARTALRTAAEVADNRRSGT